MDASFVKTPAVQALLDKSAGLAESGGDARAKAIVRDLLEAIMTVIARHDVSESEFWLATHFLAQGAGSSQDNYERGEHACAGDMARWIRWKKGHVATIPHWVQRSLRRDFQ